MKTNLKAILLLLLLLFSCLCLKSQSKQNEPLTPWYVTIKGGMPFGVSTFTSFSNDKVHLGYDYGVSVGYKYNSIFSTELSASFGKMGLGPSKCCSNYWLWDGGYRYLMPILNEEGYFYKDLYSSVSFQQYGLQVNIDLLPIFNPNTSSRFNFSISPAIYGMVTNATIKTVAKKVLIKENNSQFGFGVGGDISVGYKLTRNLTIRLSSGINYVLGKRFDGIQVDIHNSNFVLNNNISFIWNFSKKKKKKNIPRF